MEFNTEEDEIGQALNDVHSTPIGENCPKNLGPVYAHWFLLMFQMFLNPNFFLISITARFHPYEVMI